MKILLTGASGFLGKYITKELTKHTIATIGRSASNTIQFDLSANQVPYIPIDYDIVVHAAGKAHAVPETEKERRDFFDVNVGGTKLLLKSLEQVKSLKSFIFISSVSVYGQETGKLISEDSPLLATDPYGKSKIEAERLIIDWCDTKKIPCTIFRLPLIAGDNPPGNLGAMIKAIKKGYYFNIGGGSAKKSIVLAKDVAKIIPLAAHKGGTYNLTDGHHPSFFELSKLIAHQLGKSKPLNMPTLIAVILARIGDLIGNKAPLNGNKLSKILSELTFDDSKARRLLDWKPSAVLDKFKVI